MGRQGHGPSMPLPWPAEPLLADLKTALGTRLPAEEFAALAPTFVGCVESGQVYDNDVALAKVGFGGGYLLNRTHLLSKGVIVVKVEEGLRQLEEARRLL